MHCAAASVVVILSFLVLHGVADVDIKCPEQPAELPSLLTVTGPACGYRLAMEPNKDNDSFVDIYLEGTQSGWVAVGFSYDQKMAFSDVMGCKRDEQGNVGAIDSWNGQHPPNVIDPTQDGVCEYDTKFVDGKFSCFFSRYAGILNEDFDYDLNGSYYLLLGCSETQTNLSVNFPYHQPNIPVATADMINIYNVTHNPEVSLWERRMIRAHGILMVFAYPLFLATAVFIAAWMKPVLPRAWFYIHSTLMCLSLFVAVLSFIIIFVANKDNPTPGLINLRDCGTKTTHFVFGILVMFLHLVNPILAIFRPKPDHQNRWIFNLFHGLIFGHTVEVISLINIGLGAAIFQTNCANVGSSNTMLWLYVVWCLLYAAIQLFLIGYFTIKYFDGDIDNAPTVIKLIHKAMVLYGVNASYLPISDTRDGSVKKENIIRYGMFCVQLGITLLIVFIMLIFIAGDSF